MFVLLNHRSDANLKQWFPRMLGSLSFSYIPQLPPSRLIWLYRFSAQVRFLLTFLFFPSAFPKNSVGLLELRSYNAVD